MPNGDVTAVGFWCPEAQDSLCALLSGAEVTLAGGMVVPAAGGVVVPATASGLPRAVGKTLKMKTMME